MTLDELRTLVQQTQMNQINEHRRECTRRKGIILAALNALGITTRDGWTIELQPEDEQGVKVGHPELPNTVLLLVTGEQDGNTVWIEHRDETLSTAVRLAELMNANQHLV